MTSKAGTPLKRTSPPPLSVISFCKELYGSMLKPENSSYKVDVLRNVLPGTEADHISKTPSGTSINGVVRENIIFLERDMKC